MYNYANHGYQSGMGVFPLIISLVIGVVAIVSLWRIFTKAGKPGWASLVPIYNFYVLFDITWGKGIYFLLTFIPFVNIVITIMTISKLAKVFGKGGGFALGLFFFSPIFMLILAFGSAVYIGPQNTYAQNQQLPYQPQQNYAKQPQYQPQQNSQAQSPYQSQQNSQAQSPYQSQQNFQAQSPYQSQQNSQTQSQYQQQQSTGAGHCAVCGAQLGSGLFCSSCGTKVQKAPSIPAGSWQCSCGRVNSGEFCPICGNKR